MWYHINFDLKNAETEDYDDVIEVIQKYDAYCKVLFTGWVVLSSKSAIIIRDELIKSTKKSMYILITPMPCNGGSAAYLKSSKIDYLVKNLDWTSK